jgi:hypothetical protein
MSHTLIRLLPVLAVLMLAAPSADAVDVLTQTRTVIQLATGLCGANNPANEPKLRRLPSGIRNTDPANVSVVCSQWGDDAAISGSSYVFVYFKNDKAVNYTIACTLTMGVPSYTTTVVTKSVIVTAGTDNFIGFSPSDYGSDTNAQWVNLQCSLPQAFTMREIGFNTEENIGS